MTDASSLKAILGPMPWTRIMPTGGVEPEEASIKAWFGAGIVAAGMGSKLITQMDLDASDYAAIQAKVAYSIALVRKVRGR